MLVYLLYNRWNTHLSNRTSASRANETDWKTLGGGGLLMSTIGQWPCKTPHPSKRTQWSGPPMIPTVGTALAMETSYGAGTAQQEKRKQYTVSLILNKNKICMPTESCLSIYTLVIIVIKHSNETMLPHKPHCVLWLLSSFPNTQRKI